MHLRNPNWRKELVPRERDHSVLWFPPLQWTVDHYCVTHIMMSGRFQVYLPRTLRPLSPAVNTYYFSYQKIQHTHLHFVYIMSLYTHIYSTHTIHNSHSQYTHTNTHTHTLVIHNSHSQYTYTHKHTWYCTGIQQLKLRS